MRALAQFASAAWLGLAAAAQAPTPTQVPAPPTPAPTQAPAKASEPGSGQNPGQGTSQNSGPVVVVRSHDAERGRDLFRCCDRDGDDRLDLFEARAAVDALMTPRGIAAFRRLDGDRDGFLDWPEFDRYYRDLIRDGHSLRLRLARQPRSSMAPADAPATPRSPQRQLLEWFDADHDGGLTRAERDTLLRELGMPPMFAAVLDQLDADHNGRVDEHELAPSMGQLNLTQLFARGSSSRPAAALPPPWAQIDANGDGSVDAAELAAALRRIDPELARWAEQILARNDRDHNGRLGADELPKPAPRPAKAMAGPTPKR